MESDSLLIAPLARLGPLELTSTVLTTWVITGALWLGCWWVTRKLRVDPGPLQVTVEGIVMTMEDAIAAVTPDHARRILPVVGTLWLYLVIANLAGLVPGAHAPTRDLSATAALAIIVFLAAHWYGISISGPRSYLQHYLKPSPLLLPFHLISEATRTIALAVRLFGNIMSLEMAALMILLVAGFLAPVPILLLHVVEALVQAYIFGMLALIYIAGGVQSQQLKRESRGAKDA